MFPLEGTYDDHLVQPPALCFRSDKKLKSCSITGLKHLKCWCCDSRAPAPLVGIRQLWHSWQNTRGIDTQHRLPGHPRSLVCITNDIATQQVKSSLFICTCTVIICRDRYILHQFAKCNYKTFENFTPSYPSLMSLDGVIFLFHFYKFLILSFLSRPILFCL